MTLPKETKNRIAIQAEEIYNELDELAQERNPFEYGLPMYDKVKEPIERALIAEATRSMDREKGLVEALREIRKACPDKSGFARICDKALTPYAGEQGKEVGK